MQDIKCLIQRSIIITNKSHHDAREIHQMNRENISLSLIFQAERKRKAEILRKQKAIDAYQPDLVAIAENGYDRNDPGFVQWEYRKKFGKQIFKNLVSEALCKDYANYPEWKNQTFCMKRNDEWHWACEIIDTIIQPLFLCLKRGIVSVCLYSVPVLKEIIFLPFQLTWGLILLCAAIFTIPFRFRRIQR